MNFGECFFHDDRDQGTSLCSEGTTRPARGQRSPTHALLAGSPAIDRGNNAFTAIPLDQRGLGYERIVDIAAFELQARRSSLPPSGTPNNIEACVNGGCRDFGYMKPETR
ncbi:MAG TPA: choice-of-anchor Q domain-containing protein [Rubrobacter sp.]|nr:choice-of-anchor Q domain-containing protein [Rubrobacter sp.]